MCKYQNKILQCHNFLQPFTHIFPNTFITLHYTIEYLFLIPIIAIKSVIILSRRNANDIPILFQVEAIQIRHKPNEKGT